MAAAATRSEPRAVTRTTGSSGADARTVAEVWAQKGGLKEKSVTIRGQVVKYNPGVMGKNWIHLQDGSGEASKGNHDITVTSQDPAAKGDIVTVKGIVRQDKDADRRLVLVQVGQSGPGGECGRREPVGGRRGERHDERVGPVDRDGDRVQADLVEAGTHRGV